MKSINLMK